jgi:hypothetical protein
MDILISVYSPTGKLLPKYNPRNEDDDCPKNIFRQNQCKKKYSVLLYLSTLTAEDAKV